MSSLFDDLARILARPMPRRQAFRLVGKTFGAAVLATLGVGVGRADGPATCPGGTLRCGTSKTGPCCSTTTQKCCFGGTITEPHCCAPTDVCCAKSCCPNGTTCGSQN